MHANALLRYVRENLHVIDPHQRRRGELDATDDAIPGRAERIRDAVAVDTVSVIARIADDLAVIDADREAVFARRDRAEIELVGRDETVAGTDFRVVDPDGRLPVGALEEKREVPIRLARRNLEVALIPCGAEI